MEQQARPSGLASAARAALTKHLMAEPRYMKFKCSPTLYDAPRSPFARSQNKHLMADVSLAG